MDARALRYVPTATACSSVRASPDLRHVGARTVKQVVAIVKPYLVEKVLDALKHAPLEACGVREVKGYGRQKSYLDEYRGSEYSLAYIPKVEVTLWVDDFRVEEVVRTIVEVARTGRQGDGKIFVLPAGVPGAGAEEEG